MKLYEEIKSTVLNMVNAENNANAWKDVAKENKNQANQLIKTAAKLDGIDYDCKAVIAHIMAEITEHESAYGDETTEQDETEVTE